MKRNRVLLAAGAAAALLALTSHASPYWTLHRMKTAIVEKDADRFSSYIDFPALRESVKGHMRVLMSKRMSGPDMANHPFVGIGQMMGSALINPMVDAAVSPAGVIAMFEPGKAQPLQGQGRSTESATHAESVHYAFDYESWSKVAISKPGRTAAVLS